MYKLPPTEKLLLFVDAVLIQICIGLNEAILRFDKRATITILGDFAVLHEDGQESIHEAGPVGATVLLGLLHQRVSAVTVVDARTVGLQFESGTRLLLRDDSDQYESYWLEIDDQLVVV